jgi:pimeloyl-ACP methyl ester carboxylesterase
MTTATAAAGPIAESLFADLPNGTRLHYASAGRRGAPLMLFVHGFPEFWYEWEAQLAAFGDTHYAVARHMGGYNLSSTRGAVEA